MTHVLNDALHAVQLLVQLEEFLVHHAEAQAEAVVTHVVDVRHEVVARLYCWRHLLVTARDEWSVGEICR